MKLRFVLTTALIVISSFILTACGEPTFDATSGTTRGRSIMKILNSLEGKQQTRFTDAIAYLYAMAKSNTTELTYADLNSELHGKTGKKLLQWVRRCDQHQGSEIYTGLSYVSECEY